MARMSWLTAIGRRLSYAYASFFLTLERHRRMFSNGEVREMATVFDVAAYVLEKQGPMTAMKLQKLVYYSQAWSLVWDERPLFDEKIKAWANGPVIPELYHEHKGQFEVTSISRGKSDLLTDEQKDTIDRVLKFYGGKSSQWLSDLTHNEEPWRSARKGLAMGERGNQEITHAAMAEYYGSLV